MCDPLSRGGHQYLQDLPDLITTKGRSIVSPTTTNGEKQMALSTESTGVGASDENQDALEGRFIALYERLMEKQVSFKEAVEPFKTDNQNAGKG